MGVEKHVSFTGESFGGNLIDVVNIFSHETELHNTISSILPDINCTSRLPQEAGQQPAVPPARQPFRQLSGAVQAVSNEGRTVGALKL